MLNIRVKCSLKQRVLTSPTILKHIYKSKRSLLHCKGFPRTIYHKLDRFPTESGESTWAVVGIPSINRK